LRAEQRKKEEEIRKKMNMKSNYDLKTKPYTFDSEGNFIIIKKVNPNKLVQSIAVPKVSLLLSVIL
jgi:hypothetical protein